MATDSPDGERWQVKFYLMCALSVAIIGVVVLYTTPRNWTGGFMLGYATASITALIFLAVQHWAFYPRGDVNRT